MIGALALAAVAATKWDIHEERFPADGSTSYVARLHSTAISPAADGPKDAAVFGINCNEQGFLATVDFPGKVRIDASDQISITVRWQADDGPAGTAQWVAGDQMLVFIGDPAKRWVHGIAHAHRLTVFAPGEHGELSASFAIDGIDGIDRAVAPLSCGYDQASEAGNTTVPAASQQ